MIRAIEKSFNLAYPRDTYTGPDSAIQLRGAEISRAEKDAWSSPRHPTNPSLTVLDTYPILPDLEALPDTGSYMVIKYNSNPSHTSDSYDPKLDYILLQPRDSTQEQQAKYAAEKEARIADPSLPETTELFDFTTYILDSDEALPSLKRKYNVYDPDNDDESLYSHQNPTDVSDGPHFVFNKLRAYETTRNIGTQQSPWEDSLVIALHDGPSDPKRSRRDGPKRQKAAYAYPVGSQVRLRQYRQQLNRSGVLVQDEPETGIADEMEVTIGDWDEEAAQKLEDRKKELDPLAV
jgi:RNA polymerase II-associated factor 1